jgi:hypothetical protein
VYRLTYRPDGRCLILAVDSLGDCFRPAKPYPEPIQNALVANPEALQCTFVPNLGPTQAQAEIAPRLALWAKEGITANLTYTRPTYTDVHAAAGDLLVPLEDLWAEMVLGRSLTEAVRPSTNYDPLTPAYFEGQRYPTLYVLADAIAVRPERLYWLHDRRLLTRDRIWPKPPSAP